MAGKVGYRVVTEDQKSFKLYHADAYLCTFTRKNLREVLEHTADGLGFSSKWIGSILKIFHKAYPLTPAATRRDEFSRLVSILGVEGFADYLRSKGFRVVKKLAISDWKIIKFLEESGYEVEGLVNDVYYNSAVGVDKG